MYYYRFTGDDSLETKSNKANKALIIGFYLLQTCQLERVAVVNNLQRMLDLDIHCGDF